MNTPAIVPPVVEVAGWAHSPVEDTDLPVVLVAASRELSSKKLLRSVLDALLADVGPFILMQGACETGGDLYSSEWADEHATDGVINDPHPADWDRFGGRRKGNPAGPIRNKAMVAKAARLQAAGRDVRAEFFLEPGALNKGTRGCARMAEAAGIPNRIWAAAS